MATAHRADPTHPPPAAEMQPLTVSVDVHTRTVTIAQRRSPLLLTPETVVITFDTVELVFLQVFQLGLLGRGVLQQASVVPPSDSRSDLSRPLPPGSRPQ